MNGPKYNGWTNYETWCVNLWAENEYGWYQDWRAQASELDEYDLAQYMKEQVNEAAPDLGGTVWSDLLGAALSEVNWLEIARAWKEGAE